MEELKTTVIDYSKEIFAINQEMVRAFMIVGSNKALLLDTGAIRIQIVSSIRQLTDQFLLLFLHKYLKYY